MNVLVTGASGGIGSGVASALAAQGDKLALHYRTNAPEIAGALIQADLSQPGSGKQVVEQALAALGHFDGIVCCHGAAQVSLFQDVAEEDWDQLFSTNVSSIHKVLAAALPHMIRQRSGSIVLISSMWGVAGASCEAAYSAAKGTVVTLSRALAKELGPSGIRVNCIAPGLIDTAMNARLSEEEKAAIVADTPLGRMGTPRDVAQAAAFLLSNKSDFITGQTLLLDGGYTL